MQVRVKSEACRVFEDVSGDRPVLDHVRHGACESAFCFADIPSFTDQAKHTFLIDA
jgi:hypothetical protein